MEHLHHPQSRPYTQIPNEYLEYIASLRLSAECMSVLLAIIRLTWGWHKAQDTIALSQMAAITKMQVTHIARAIKNLKEVGLISMTQLGHRRPLRYRLLYPNQVIDYDLTRSQTMTQPGHSLYPNQVTSKEIKKKKEIKDRETSSLFPQNEEKQLHEKQEIQKAISTPKPSPQDVYGKTQPAFAQQAVDRVYSSLETEDNPWRRLKEKIKISRENHALNWDKPKEFPQ